MTVRATSDPRTGIEVPAWRVLLSFVVPARVALRLLRGVHCGDPNCVYCNPEVEAEMRRQGLIGG